MRLLKLRLHGYRRFREPQTLRVEGRLVALVGPNEGGKTSILEALVRVTEETQFSTDPAKRELSRGASIKPDQVVLAALFAVEPKDLVNIPTGLDASWITTFWCQKRADGGCQIHFDQDSRFLTDATGASSRAAALELLHAMPIVNHHDAFLADLVLEAISLVEPKGVLDLVALRGLIAKLLLGQTKYLNELQGIAQHLSEVASLYEEALKQEDLARTVLKGCLPLFRLFRIEDRELRSTYSITGKAPRQPQKDIDYPDANPALNHLLNASGLNRGALPKSVRRRYPEDIAKWKDEANANLTAILSKGWTQSDIAMKLDVNGHTLQVMAGPRTSYTLIEERSQGMRMFVALAAFIESQRSANRDIILLIDEAEQHLHYDAQASLVEMLARQTHARQVIYSTHSAGCLPEDLGTSVRVVRPTESDSSEILNSIWHGGQNGFRPLHLQLGASTFAFSSVRQAVFVEGVIDCALLPSLIKEAVQTDILGYQMVPGISQANPETIPDMRREAARVAFFLDGDEAGDQKVKALRAWKVSRKQIFQLPPNLVTEDLVDDDIYLRAVNAVISRRYPRKALSLEDILGPNRPSKVIEACTSRIRINPPDKTEVAIEVFVARDSSGVGLLNHRYKDSLAKIHRKLVSYLETQER